MNAFERALQLFLPIEGGDHTDPQDPGGRTNEGIAYKYHPELNPDTCTHEDRMRVYKRDFWDFMRCDELHPAVAVQLFNFACGSGPDDAVKALQNYLGVRMDGVIGPVTIAAASRRDPREASARLCALYTVHQSQCPNWERNRYGWSWRNSLVSMLAADLLAGR